MTPMESSPISNGALRNHLLIVDTGLWTVACGQWLVDSGLWTVATCSMSIQSAHLGHIDLALVHELDDCRDVGEGSVLEDDHLVGLVEIDEEMFKVRTAGGQDHLRVRRI